MLAKKIFKYEVSIWTNGKDYQSPVRTPGSENIFSVSRLVSKGATIGATQDKKLLSRQM